MKRKDKEGRKEKGKGKEIYSRLLKRRKRKYIFYNNNNNNNPKGRLKRDYKAGRKEGKIKTYFRRINKILETKLNSRKFIKGMNIWAVRKVRHT